MQRLHKFRTKLQKTKTDPQQSASENNLEDKLASQKELDAGEAPGKDLTANEPNKRKSVIENLKFALNAMTKTNNQFTNTRLESQLEKYVTQINSSSIDDDKLLDLTPSGIIQSIQRRYSM